MIYFAVLCSSTELLQNRFTILPLFIGLYVNSCDILDYAQHTKRELKLIDALNLYVHSIFYINLFQYSYLKLAYVCFMCSVKPSFCLFLCLHNTYCGLSHYMYESVLIVCVCIRPISDSPTVFSLTCRQILLSSEKSESDLIYPGAYFYYVIAHSSKMERCNKACSLLCLLQFSTKYPLVLCNIRLCGIAANRWRIVSHGSPKCFFSGTGHWTWDDSRESVGSLSYPQSAD